LTSNELTRRSVRPRSISTERETKMPNKITISQVRPKLLTLSFQRKTT
jgi:hypothetical protein